MAKFRLCNFRSSILHPRLLLQTVVTNLKSPAVGQVAQLVEQWTENPCVAGSIPALPMPEKTPEKSGVFCFRDFACRARRMRGRRLDAPIIAGSTIKAA